ncbi:hypothetical protein Vadar_012251 [Vaccinium darrowii]|uniref:Uncharacterized protein n=1 Tax=Vaccinium darrowii TaxID=229202 RepID=A0ACB7YKY4_9ERIC|nr:hypothetical protein Vadar_012251 [Vaccinium darrowii]
MATQNPLHFLLLPHLTHGHTIPMIDIAKLLAQHNVSITIITTPLTASRYTTTISRSTASGLNIQLLHVPFPASETGLPDGCETMESLPSPDLIPNFLNAIKLLQHPIEQLIDNLNPPLSCIISDKYLAWSSETAKKNRIPWLVFDGTSCFSLQCTHNILSSRIHESVSGSEPFVVPGLLHRIELTRSQLPSAVTMEDAKGLRAEIRAAEMAAYGVVVNSFEELESGYLEELRKVRGKVRGKVWCIGPVSLCNKDDSDKLERGRKPSFDKKECLEWLDLQGPRSVVYVCFGSASRFSAAQLMEIGLGLEASGRPFVWVVRGGKLEEFEKWVMEDGFEGRNKGRGILIRGWAPQVLILSHRAIGGFVTHCGWNSTLEGLCAGVPMVTWPLFADQFYNEKLVVQVLRVGVPVGVEFGGRWGEEKYGVAIRRGGVKKAVEELLGGGDEGRERRERASDLGEMAKKAVEEGGSSFLNIECLIQDIREQVMAIKPLT